MEAGTALKGAQNPVVRAALQYGKQMHAEYKAAEANGSTFVKEFRFANGLRADAVDFTTNTIYELKPNNARAVNQGYNQLNKYIQQASQQFGGSFKGVLETYTRP